MISKSILEISAISVSVMLLITMVFAVTVYSAPTAGDEPVEKVSCHDRILSYERIGAYQDKETFNLALSYCNPPSAL